MAEIAVNIVMVVGAIVAVMGLGRKHISST